MEKILSDIQLAEVEVRYYEIHLAHAKKCESHALVAAWQKGMEAEQKHLESLYQAEQEMQHLDKQLDPDGLGPEGQQAWRAFEREQALELPYEERERLADLERLAYCGYEEF